MALRRREKRTDRSKLDATPPWELRHRDDPEATTGPYDERDRPADDLARVDLGALEVPIGPDLEMRLDLDDTQRVVSVTLVGPDGHLQLGVFAAPRNEGIWEEVRAEIAASINEQRGTVDEQQEGVFGVELVGTLPGEPGAGSTPVRFVGVDGPRWFLRGMFVGPVAVDAAKAEVLENLLRGVVVVRGTDPLPVREPVALRLPKEVQEAQEAQRAADQAAGEAAAATDEA